MKHPFNDKGCDTALCLQSSAFMTAASGQRAQSQTSYTFDSHKRFYYSGISTRIHANAYLSRSGGFRQFPLRGDSSGQRSKDLYSKVSKDLLPGLHKGVPRVGRSQIFLTLPYSVAC